MDRNTTIVVLVIVVLVIGLLDASRGKHDKPVVILVPLRDLDKGIFR